MRTTGHRRVIAAAATTAVATLTLIGTPAHARTPSPTATPSASADTTELTRLYLPFALQEIEEGAPEHEELSLPHTVRFAQSPDGAWLLSSDEADAEGGPTKFTTGYTWAGTENWYWSAKEHSKRTKTLDNVWKPASADVLQADFNRNKA
ncbi:hypothetical protein AB0A94_01525 [Streptomyces sp. NPDC044984]|uniref:hypothetical protein n=1 Tax=Streptomyces sp. NPDC044984 TaxID=3154335 RepID=UPI0033C8AEF9